MNYKKYQKYVSDKKAHYVDVYFDDLRLLKNQPTANLDLADWLEDNIPDYEPENVVIVYSRKNGNAKRKLDQVSFRPNQRNETLSGAENQFSNPNDHLPAPQPNMPTPYNQEYMRLLEDKNELAVKNAELKKEIEHKEQKLMEANSGSGGLSGVKDLLQNEGVSNALTAIIAQISQQGMNGQNAQNAKSYGSQVKDSIIPQIEEYVKGLSDREVQDLYLLVYAFDNEDQNIFSILKTYKNAGKQNEPQKAPGGEAEYNGSFRSGGGGESTSDAGTDN